MASPPLRRGPGNCCAALSGAGRGGRLPGRICPLPHLAYAPQRPELWRGNRLGVCQDRQRPALPLAAGRRTPTSRGRRRAGSASGHEDAPRLCRGPEKRCGGLDDGPQQLGCGGCICGARPGTGPRPSALTHRLAGDRRHPGAPPAARPTAWPAARLPAAWPRLGRALGHRGAAALERPDP